MSAFEIDIHVKSAIILCTIMRLPSLMGHLLVPVRVLLRVFLACIQVTIDGLLCNSVILGRVVSHLQMNRATHVGLLK
jgi:hypothetical protein